MRCCSVRLLLVAMLATQHTDFESFANALGALPNQPPVPMACEPSPSPIDVDTKAIVQQVVDVLLKHSPSPAVHLEVLGRRWLALARNESVTNLTSTLLPAKVSAMNKRDKRAREVLELMPVTPGCPQATIALLTSQASTHRSAADIKVLRRCGNRAVQLAEAGLKQPTSATSKVVPAATMKALDAHRAAEQTLAKYVRGCVPRTSLFWSCTRETCRCRPIIQPSSIDLTAHADIGFSDCKRTWVGSYGQASQSQSPTKLDRSSSFTTADGRVSLRTSRCQKMLRWTG